MKIRGGFVSNSSSSSFVIDSSKYSGRDIETYIQKLLDAENFIESTDLTVADICVVYDLKDTTEFWSDRFEYECYGQSGQNKETYIEIKQKSYPAGFILVESIRDNSIPWSIQNSLEELSGSKRFHWG